jgi:hypothetical protein
MIKIIIIFLLLLIIYLLYNYEKMDNNVQFLDSTKSLFIHNKIFEKHELIEITNIPTCKKILYPNLSSNYNNIVNNEISISQSMVDFLINTIEIDSLNYNLLKLEWKRSKFLYKNKPVGLELHILLNSFKGGNNISIVIPLDLKQQNKTTESFVNLFYYTDMNNEINGYINNDNYIHLKKSNIINENDDLYTEIANVDTNIIKHNYFNANKTYANIKNSFPDINISGDIFENINKEKGKYNLNLEYNNNINLDNLLTNTNEIPTYQCCKESIGPLVNLHFCNLDAILKNITIFYKLFDETGKILYITDPLPYNEDIGLYIRNVIIDENVNYIVPVL